MQPKKCIIRRGLSEKYYAILHAHADDPKTITEFDMKWIGEKNDLEHFMKFECGKLAWKINF